MLYGPQAALIAECFTPPLRYSGSSIGYQLNANPKPFSWTKDPNKIIATTHAMVERAISFIASNLRCYSLLIFGWDVG